MPTLTACIEAFEARRSHRHYPDTVAEIVGPFPTRAVLTAKGEAVALIERLADLLGVLNEADRNAVQPLLDELVHVDMARAPTPPIVGQCKVWFQTRPIAAPNIDVWIVRDESGQQIERFEADNESVAASDATYAVAKAFTDELNARVLITA